MCKPRSATAACDQGVNCLSQQKTPQSRCWWLENSVDIDQTIFNVQTDLALHCLQCPDVRWANAPFPTMFAKVIYYRGVEGRIYGVKG